MNLMLVKRKSDPSGGKFVVYLQSPGYPALLQRNMDEEYSVEDLLFPRKFKELGFEDPNYLALLSQVTAGLLSNPNVVKKLCDLDESQDLFGISQKAEEIAVWMYYDTPFTEFI